MNKDKSRALRWRKLQDESLSPHLDRANLAIIAGRQSSGWFCHWRDAAGTIEVRLMSEQYDVRLRLNVPPAQFKSKTYDEILPEDVGRAEWRYATELQDVREATQTEAAETLQMVRDVLAAHPEQITSARVKRGDIVLESRPGSLAMLSIEEPDRLIGISIGADGWRGFDGARWEIPAPDAAPFAAFTTLHRRAAQ